MVERETREQAQERILVLQAELMERLEKNPKYLELKERWLDSGENCADYLLEQLMPQLYDPKYEISQLLQNISTCKAIIGHANRLAIKSAENSELCSEVIEDNRHFIRDYLQQIRKIQKGEFEWVI